MVKPILLLAIFQSTLSVRRATLIITACLPTNSFISIHALREESDPRGFEEEKEKEEISIHALREESDPQTSTITDMRTISIHALREESDSKIQHNIYS